METGLIDINGREVVIGDTIKMLDSGFIGPVVRINGAIRVDVAGGEYLRYKSSLLYGDGGIKLFEIIKGKL